MLGTGKDCLRHSAASSLEHSEDVQSPASEMHLPVSVSSWKRALIWSVLSCLDRNDKCTLLVWDLKVKSVPFWVFWVKQLFRLKKYRVRKPHEHRTSHLVQKKQKKHEKPYLHWIDYGKIRLDDVTSKLNLKTFLILKCYIKLFSSV